MSNSTLSKPVSLTFFEDTLYWMDATKHEGSISKAPISNLSDITVLEQDLGPSVSDIQIFSRRKQSKKSANHIEQDQWLTFQVELTHVRKTTGVASSFVSLTGLRPFACARMECLPMMAEPASLTTVLSCFRKYSALSRFTWLEIRTSWIHRTRPSRTRLSWKTPLVRLN